MSWRPGAAATAWYRPGQERFMAHVTSSRAGGAGRAATCSSAAPATAPATTACKGRLLQWIVPPTPPAAAVLTLGGHGSGLAAAGATALTLYGGGPATAGGGSIPPVGQAVAVEKRGRGRPRGSGAGHGAGPAAAGQAAAGGGPPGAVQKRGKGRPRGSGAGPAAAAFLLPLRLRRAVVCRLPLLARLLLLRRVVFLLARLRRAAEHAATLSGRCAGPVLCLFLPISSSLSPSFA